MALEFGDGILAAIAMDIFLGMARQMHLDLLLDGDLTIDCIGQPADR